MYARVVTAQIAPDRMDEAIRIWRESQQPVLEQQRGWKSLELLIDREANTALIVSVWETEADLKAVGVGSRFWQEHFAHFAALLSTAPSVERYHVALDARGS